MWDFLRFLIIWISQNLAIPFWVVGHVHLHFKNYHDLLEYAGSLLMHLIVAFGFYLDYKDHRKENEAKEDRESKTLSFFIDASDK